MTKKENSKNCIPKLVLHSCCGPCSTSVIEKLLERFEIVVYFYNPNITGTREYEKRKEAQKKVVESFVDLDEELSLVEGRYDSGEFYEAVKGYEHLKEGGARCSLCFLLRLEETARFAKENNIEYFATTLSVSPHKNQRVIGAIGRRIAEKYNLIFLDEDFKKADGFRRSVELSKELNIYRQNFCGCEFSKWPGAKEA